MRSENTKAITIALAVALIGGFCNSGQASTRWEHNPAEPGDWFDADNWTDGVPWGAGTAHVDNGGIAEIRSGSARAGRVFVGNIDDGTILQSDGIVTIRGASGPDPYLALGSYMGDGRYELTGGELHTAGTSVGYWDGGGRVTGNFVHSSGLHSVSGWLELANSERATGYYELGGDAQVEVGVNLIVGYVGTGTFNQTGGSMTVAEAVCLSRNSRSSGTYSISGGSFTAGSMIVGMAADLGQGMFEVEGASSSVSMDSYSQTRTGTLQSRIGTGGLSSIEVIDSASLRGTWRVVDEGAPVGRYNVLAARGGISGNFDAVVLPDSSWSWYIASEIIDGQAVEVLYAEHVPEPVTMSLGLMGLCSVGLYLRKRLRA